MFPIYPYINVNDLNLDYLLKAIKDIQTQVEYFVSLNAIKYANPIQWDITRQYEKNTIVIDPQTGTAYISVAPVPIGAQLTRPEYWTVVFDLGSFVVRASKNFAINYEADTTTTATFNTPKGGWLVWGDVLYIANVPITAGDSYVDGGNISHFTMEEIIGHLSDLSTTDKSSIVNAINELYGALNNAVNALSLMIGDLNDLTTTDKTSIVNAINELVTNIGNIVTSIGDLNDLTTTDTSSIVNAINELVTVFGVLSNIIGDLNDLITIDKTSIVNAINEVKGDFNAEDLKVGDLADLTTTDKSSIVNAINDVSSIIPPGVVLSYYTPSDYGGVGDGVTDDTQAVLDCVTACNNDKKDFYIPLDKTYLVSSKITYPNTINVYMDGWLKTSNDDGIEISYAAGMKKYYLKVMHSSFGNGIGIKFKFPYNCDIHIDVAHFEKDVVFEGGAYNKIYPNWISDSHYNFVADTTDDFFNENDIIGGRFRRPDDNSNNTAISLLGNNYRINNNVFLKPCVEGATVGVHLKNCTTNRFINMRTEAAVTAVTAQNESTNNIIECAEGPRTYTRLDTSNQINKVCSPGYDAGTLLFESGSLASKIITNTSEAHMPGFVGIDENGAVGMPSYMTKYNDYIGGNGSTYIGIKVDL